MYKALVLNSDYRPFSVFPLQTIPWTDAMVRLSIEPTVHVVAKYDEVIPTGGRHNIHYPAVVARNEYLARDKYPTFRSESIFYRDGKKCQYCGNEVSQRNISLDHVMPKSKGGSLSWENIVLACTTCNTAKGDNLPVGQWKPRLSPYKPTYGQLVNARKKFPITLPHQSWVDFLGDWPGGIVIQSPKERK